MDIQFYGANCISFTTKQARILVDDNLAELGGKSVLKDGDISLFTSSHKKNQKGAKLVLDQPGEYEVSGVSIYGIAARAHTDTEKEKTATIYKLIADDTSVLVTGHVYPELNDAQLEAIGMVDVMIVPVGGNGYTLDAVGALRLIKKLGPKVVVPSYYDDDRLNFPVPAQSLEQALQTLGMEPKAVVQKFSFKPAEIADTTQLIVLERVG